MRKKLTSFGVFCRNQRKRFKMTISEYAKLLGVSIAYVSSVEYGDRPIPSKWKLKIIKIFSLENEEIVELQQTIVDSIKVGKISFDDIKWCMTNMVDNLFEVDSPEKEKALATVEKFINDLKNSSQK